MDERLLAGLQRLENMRDQFGETILRRIDQAIREAERLARMVVICPDCGQRMVRERTMVTCPGCGLCLSDSDAPTAEFAPVNPGIQQHNS